MHRHSYRAIAIVVAFFAFAVAVVRLPGSAENLVLDQSPPAVLLPLFGRSQAKSTPQSPKFLQFPNDRSIGRVFQWLPHMARGDDYCEAIGKVPCAPGYIFVLRPHATQVTKPKYFDQVPTNVEGLDMASFDVDNALVERLSNRFKNLRVFSIEDGDIDDKVFDSLVKLPRLEYLDLKATAINGSGLTRLSRMPALTQINFTQSTLYPENCKYLLLAPNLIDVRVAHCAISDLSCRYLGQMTKLKLLCIDNTLVTDKGIAQLIPLKNTLIDIDLSNCNVVDGGFKSLGQITSLQTIKMRTGFRPALTAKAFKYLRSAKNLNSLDLGSSDPDNEIVEAIVKYVPMLKSLNLSRCKRITDKGLSKLSSMKNLEAIYVSESGAGDGLLEMAKFLPKLGMLQSGGTQIGDNAMVRFCDSCSPVEQLVLDNTKITDAGLKSIFKLKNLKSVAFNGDRLTDRSAKYLSEVKSLQGLGLQNTQFTRKGVSQIKRALPGCFVRY